MVIGTQFDRLAGYNAGVKESAYAGILTSSDSGSFAPAVPGYRMGRLIAAGGQGQVFQAIRLSNAQKVAIKFIRADRLAEPHARARFQQEARTLSLLNHPGIVRVVDSGELESGQLWFAAEYVSGQTLSEHVNQLDRCSLEAQDNQAVDGFPVRRVLDLFVQICDAVEAAHRVGVLHRDLKPSNVLVDESGRVRVLDFGLAKAPEVNDPALVTLTGQFLGSPAWCSPEQIDARPSAIDVRSDVYSLGVVLYNLLTGTFPYSVENRPLADVFDAIRHAEPTPPSAHSAIVDNDLDTIILKTIAKPRDRRYASAGELRNEIQRYLRGEPILAKEDGWAYVTAKFLRRHPVLTGVVMAVSILSVGYGAMMTLLYHRAVVAERSAQANADDARAKFRMAQRTAEAMLSQLDEVLRKTAGMGGVRKTLLAQLSTQFEVLTQEQGNDPALQADLATAHSKLADVYQSIGDIERAAAHADAALIIRKSLAAASPEDGDAQSALSIATVRVGDIARENGQLERGSELYRQAMEMDQSLVTKYPANSRYLDNLCWSFNRLAHLARQGGDDQTAGEYHRMRCEIAEQLLKGEPQSAARMLNLLDGYEQFSALQEAGEENAETFNLDRARRANALVDQLMALDAENVEYQRHFIINRNCLATALRLRNMEEEADTRAAEALEAARHMVRASPNEVIPRVLLYCSLNPQCDRAEHRSDWSLVADIGQEVLESIRKLIEVQHGAVEGRYYMYSAHLRLARAAWVCGKSDEASLHATEAISMAKQLAAERSVSADRLWDFAGGLLDVRPPALADPRLALEYAERAAAMSERPSRDKLDLLDRARATTAEQNAQP